MVDVDKIEECPRCHSLVVDPAKHQQWHKRLARRARNQGAKDAAESAD